MARSWEMEELREARKRRLMKLLPDLQTVAPSEVLPYLTECISDQFRVSFCVQAKDIRINKIGKRIKGMDQAHWT